MVLIGLLLKCLINNILIFPNHVIYVGKNDVLNIESIEYRHENCGINLTNSSTIDLCKVEKLNILYLRDSVENNIEGLCSLKTLYLETKSVEFQLSIKNVPSLINLSFESRGKIDEKTVTRLLDKVPHIQELYLGGNLCYFNLDSLVNLRVLSLFGVTEKNFNFELFKNLCNQLESIKIISNNKKTLVQLFDGYNFDLTIKLFDIKRLTKEFINRLPIARQLNISYCNIEVIESDSFSNMQQLTSLNLSLNRIESIEKNAFSNLKNLETLDLSYNKLTKFDPKFIGLGNSVEVKIQYNNFNS